MVSNEFSMGCIRGLKFLMYSEVPFKGGRGSTNVSKISFFIDPDRGCTLPPDFTTLVMDPFRLESHFLWGT